MAQSLTILWHPPVPNPTCNYIVAYRAKSAASYTFVDTTSSTSGVNSLVVPGMPPACYEGFVQSNCCGDNLSDLTHSYWGINAWQPMYFNISFDIFTHGFLVTATSVYSNPYSVLVSGSFVATTTSGGTSVPFSFTYTAGSTIYTGSFGTAPGGMSTTYSGITATMSPVFDNGGNLQQRDAVSTPQYFGFYNTSGCTSGSTSGCTAPTWNGSPILLPSFTLDGFNVTSEDTMGNPIGGQLLVSWIQSATFGGGSGIYSSITFQIYDSTGTTLQGTVTVPYGVAGLNNASIHMISTVGTIAITTQYQMRTLWADTSISATQQFYLPTF